MSSDGTDNLHQVEETLELLIENFRQLKIIIEDYQPQSQDVLYAKINEIVETFRQLDSIRTLEDVDIPVEVLDYIDSGRNPDQYTKQALEKCIESNNKTRGKINSLQHFQYSLEDQLLKSYPEEFRSYAKKSERPN